MTEVNDRFSKRTRNKYLVIIAGLSLFCIIAYPLTIKTGGYDINRGWVVQDAAENFKTVLQACLISMPILSFIIGLLVAFFPYRQLSYSKKYLRASLITWISLASLFSIGIVIIILMTVIGLYPPSNGSEKILPGRAIKEQTSATFISDIQVLCDSINWYLDVALADNRAGKANDEIAQKVNPKVLYFKVEINERLQSFSKDANDSGMSNEEYEKALEEVKQSMQPVLEKRTQLQTIGIDIK